jgi:hypothetical protein
MSEPQAEDGVQEMGAGMSEALQISHAIGLVGRFALGVGLRLLRLILDQNESPLLSRLPWY